METTYKILKLLILVLAFAVVIQGASMLYDRLSGQVDIPVIATATATEPVTETAEEPPEETAAEPAPETGTEPVSETVPEETEKEKIPAPDFTAYDLEGNPHRLSDFRGKPVVLNFWASWCGPCQSEMPVFQRFYETYGQQLHFLLVNMTDGAQETLQSASDFVAAGGYTFPVFYDTDIDAAYQYGVLAMPVTYFVDAEGNLVAYAQGALGESVLQQGVDLLLK